MKQYPAHGMIGEPSRPTYLNTKPATSSGYGQWNYPSAYTPTPTRLGNRESIHMPLYQRDTKLKIQTQIGKEFGIENHPSHNNCFLNAGL